MSRATLPEVLDRDWSMLVAGRLVPAASGRRYPDESPVIEEVIARVPDGSEADVEAAIEAGQAASERWRRVAARERGALVAELARVLDQHTEELALLDAIDVGNPVTAMRGDVAAGADLMRLIAGLAIQAGAVQRPFLGTGSLQFAGGEQGTELGGPLHGQLGAQAGEKAGVERVAAAGGVGDGARPPAGWCGRGRRSGLPSRPAS